MLILKKNMNMLIILISIITIVVQATVFISMLLTYDSWILLYKMKWSGFLKSTNMAFLCFIFFSLFYLSEAIINNEIVGILLQTTACVFNIISAGTAFINIKELVVASE